MNCLRPFTISSWALLANSFLLYSSFLRCLFHEVRRTPDCGRQVEVVNMERQGRENETGQVKQAVRHERREVKDQSDAPDGHRHHKHLAPPPPRQPDPWAHKSPRSSMISSPLCDLLFCSIILEGIIPIHGEAGRQCTYTLEDMNNTAAMITNTNLNPDAHQHERDEYEMKSKIFPPKKDQA